MNKETIFVKKITSEIFLRIFDTKKPVLIDKKILSSFEKNGGDSSTIEKMMVNYQLHKLKMIKSK